MMLKNCMEEIVQDLIEGVISDVDMCKCERCVMDVTAIALNDLPTKYVVTEKGELYTKISILRMQSEIDVVTAITKAAMIVKRSPKH